MVFPTSEQPNAVMQLALAQRKSPSIALYPGEVPAYGIPRIAIDQLEWMLFQLREQPNRDRGVHQARKSAKRLRSVLRLVRDELGYFRYRQENVVLRDVARRLSPVRTSAVFIESVDAFAASERDPLSADARSDLRRSLLARHETLANSVLEHPQLMTDVIVTLLTTRSRYRGWPVASAARVTAHPDIRAFRDSYAAIGPGLHRTYRRGRAALSVAAGDRSMHNIHMWRKRVKYLRYQMNVLVNCQPDVIGPATQDLSALGDVLGEEHDYAELGELIAGEPSFVPNPQQRFRYLTSLVAHRMELQAQALRIGARLYDETPDAFVSRIGRHWDASRL